MENNPIEIQINGKVGVAYAMWYNYIGVSFKIWMATSLVWWWRCDSI